MTEPIRVLYILNAMGGGASLGIYEIVRRMSRDQVVPYAIMPPGSALDQVEPLFAGIQVTPLAWWNVETQVDFLRRQARMLGRRRLNCSTESNTAQIIDLIHEWKIDLVHSGTSLVLSGALAAKQTGSRHIWHIKETIGQHNRVQFPYSDAELVRYISDLSDQVLVMSDYIGKPFRDHGITNVSVISDGVDLSFYDNQTSRNLRTHLGLGDEYILVAMVASLTSMWKQHDLFVRMAAAIQQPNVHYVLIGKQASRHARWPNDITRNYLHRIQNLAAKLLPRDQITFVDHFPDPADIMRSIDILVHPCEHEPFGRVAIEAMAAKRPVVGISTGGIAETVVDNETGFLVKPRNINALAAATKRLILDADLRRQFGNAGYARVRQHYDVDNTITQLNSIYAKVAQAL